MKDLKIDYLEQKSAFVLQEYNKEYKKPYILEYVKEEYEKDPEFLNWLLDSPSTIVESLTSEQKEKYLAEFRNECFLQSI